ncbi:MAG: copper-binding protein [Gammaproteobacteria bacterium]
MRSASVSLVAVSVAALFIAACGGPAPGSKTAAEGTVAPAKPAMPMPATQPVAEHMAEGTLKAIDRDAGTVTIAHGPVASANWPAMTMTFKLANPEAAANLEPDQRVEFHFTIESGMSATVTAISAAK